MPPEGNTVNITFNGDENFNEDKSLNSYITASLRAYTSDEYIESELRLTVQANISMNQTVIWCGIGNIGNESANVYVNLSGKLQYFLMFCKNSSS